MANLFRCGTYVEPAPVEYLYFWGDEFEGITGGWSADGYYYNATYPVVAGTKAEDSLYLAGASSECVMIGTNEAIDLTDYSYVEMTYSYSAVASSVGATLRVAVDKANAVTQAVTGVNITAAKSESTALLYTIRIDVSSLTGKYYIFSTILNSTSRKARIRSVQLIK